MNCNLVLLGGPVANEIAAELSGYHFQQIRGKQRDKLPVFDRESKKFSWGFFCGDKDFGDFDGLRRSATVFDAGKETRRPLYGLWDLQKDAERPALFSTDDVGFLSQEALLITRVRNPSNSARTVLMIAGAHGYSLLAFCSHLETNLTQLRELRQRQPEQHAYFQAMIPAALNHDQKARLTKAELLWEDAELAKVPSAV
ncbi:MAG: hypothetical protein HYS13_12380 [Planctomycetia bacterium]|nr:hypothetical protein [Planctomycetia bacterium]